MTQRHPHGETWDLIKFPNSSVTLEDEKLKNLLLHEDVKDRKIAIISIAGAYRKGKSFFMDYCLRFLYENYKSINFKTNQLQSPSQWLGSSTAPLTGFSWRGGSRRHTTGIAFWSDVFLCDTSTAIILVDTQGLFDTETSTDENTKILALSTLFSSTLILNLSGVIQEDQVQFLQYITEFASFAGGVNSSNSKPFQKLIFLVRDWPFADEYDFGFAGGESYLNEFLKVKPQDNVELSSVRKHLKSSFDEVLCALMPHPGKIVANQSDNYDGRWEAMDEDFREELKQVVEGIFKAQFLKTKKVSGAEVTGRDFYDVIKSYVETFATSTSLPQPKSLYETMIERFFDNLVQKSLEIHQKSLKTPQTRDEILQIQNTAKFEAILEFNNANKMGTSSHASKYLQVLEAKIADKENEWKAFANSHVTQLEEQRKLQEAHVEAHRIAEIERARRLEEAQRELEEQKRITAQRLEEARQREEQLRRERQRQRELEEQLARERERQRQLQEARRRLEEEAEERRKQNERNRLFNVRIKEIGLNFDVPKPRCVIS